MTTSTAAATMDVDDDNNNNNNNNNGTSVDDTMDAALFLALEKQYVTLKEERDAIYDAKSKLEEKLETTRDECHQSKVSLANLTSDRDILTAKDNATEEKVRTLEEELGYARERTDRTAVENDKLRLELEKMSKSKAVLQARLDAASAEVGAVDVTRFECDRYKAEAVAMTEHASHMEGQVSALRGQLVSVKKEFGKKALDAEQALMRSSDYVFRLESDAKAHEDRMEAMKETIKLLQEKVLDRDTDIASLKARYEAEEASHSNLRMLYQHKYNLLDVKMREADEYLKVVRNDAAVATASSERDRLQYEDKIALLENQVSQQAKVLEEKSAQRSRIESRMLNLIPETSESSGVKLTEVYDELLSREDELRKVKAEKVKLEKTLERVVTEMETKAPLIAQRQRDFNTMKRKYDQIKSDYEESIEVSIYLGLVLLFNL